MACLHSCPCHWDKNFTDPSLFCMQMSVDFRLYPNDLYTEGQVGFTGQYEIIPEPSDQGLFNSRCGTWGGVDSFKYANVGIESFIFNVDETTGIATRVEPKALRVSLMRQS